MDKKICLHCKTENDASFSYCRRCGSVLPVVEQKAPFNAEVVSENPSPQATARPNIDGVDEEVLKVYIGKNHTSILNRFYNMSLFNQKTSFCLPVLLLGLLFGFFGISCWFFYRKMNRIGFIFLALSLVYPLIDFIVNFGVTSSFIGEFTNLLSSSYVADEKLLSLELERIFTDYANNQRSFMPEIYSLIKGFAAPIVMSIFSLYLYKNKAIKDINRLYSTFPQDGNFMFRVFLAGGTSGSRILIPIAVFIGFSALTFFGLLAFV